MLVGIPERWTIRCPVMTGGVKKIQEQTMAPSLPSHILTIHRMKEPCGAFSGFEGSKWRTETPGDTAWKATSPAAPLSTGYRKIKGQAELSNKDPGACKRNKGLDPLGVNKFSQPHPEEPREAARIAERMSRKRREANKAMFNSFLEGTAIERQEAGSKLAGMSEPVSSPSPVVEDSRSGAQANKEPKRSGPLSEHGLRPGTTFLEVKEENVLTRQRAMNNEGLGLREHGMKGETGHENRR
ncbi:hypothetical protein F5148DRAFT_1148925 [Russula earlei]|uniref:Uncharacterized protein n=1 Tax=Russula earlei TaxID=71964 RepID=A0ACC0UAQ6_9AGAM|nr:hypothetical protein F5148DRAFT_1148925 [Russula earlei]